MLPIAICPISKPTLTNPNAPSCLLVVKPYYAKLSLSNYLLPVCFIHHSLHCCSDIIVVVCWDLALSNGDVMKVNFGHAEQEYFS